MLRQTSACRRKIAGDAGRPQKPASVLYTVTHQHRMEAVSLNQTDGRHGSVCFERVGDLGNSLEVEASELRQHR
jgi:hypothetical protein